VLSGRRGLSLKMIRALVAGLRIPAELLLANLEEPKQFSLHHRMGGQNLLEQRFSLCLGTLLSAFLISAFQSSRPQPSALNPQPLLLAATFFRQSCTLNASNRSPSKTICLTVFPPALLPFGYALTPIQRISPFDVRMTSTALACCC
jgi:hypothetical protein